MGLEEISFTIWVFVKFSINTLFWNHLEIQHGTEFNLEFSSLRSLEKNKNISIICKKNGMRNFVYDAWKIFNIHIEQWWA